MIAACVGVSMKNIGFAIAIATLAACSTAHAPINATKQQMRYGDTVTLTAVVDSVTINSIKFNRGNCLYSIGTPYGGAALPVTLKFGETRIDDPVCTVLELEVGTDQGTWTFNWSQ